MKELATINFQDAASSDDAVAIVRYDEQHIALSLSLKSNGDIQVVMTKGDGKRLLDALTKAIS